MNNRIIQREIHRGRYPICVPGRLYGVVGLKAEDWEAVAAEKLEPQRPLQYEWKGWKHWQSPTGFRAAVGKLAWCCKTVSHCSKEEAEPEEGIIQLVLHMRHYSSEESKRYAGMITSCIEHANREGQYFRFHLLHGSYLSHKRKGKLFASK